MPTGLGFLTMDDFDFRDKTVLLRVDFNSPVDPRTKTITDDIKIREHIETVRELSGKGAKVVILTHQGRLGDPDFIPLEQHARILSKILKRSVSYANDIFGETEINKIKQLRNGGVLLLENVRTYPDETVEKPLAEQAKTPMVQALAPLADVFVNDAFGAAHRAHVSMIGFAGVLPAVAGRVMERELRILMKATRKPRKPCVYVLGGAKAKDSVDIAEYVLSRGIADTVLTAGLVGNLFLFARKHDLDGANKELLEKKGFMEHLARAEDLLTRYGGQVKTPVDIAVDFKGMRSEMSIIELPSLHYIKDIGKRTTEIFCEIISNAKTIVMHGPAGAYEEKAFLYGTKAILTAISKSKGFGIVGGGHTLAAVHKLNLIKKISYVSTAGGALMDYLTGKKLPAVEALKEAATRYRKGA